MTIPLNKLPFDTEFFQLFRKIWANHANFIALQYAGSEALKTDLTRTGKRTFTGMLRDLKTAIVRYYKNNFCDGRRQDAIDLGTIHILRQHIFGHFGPPPSPTYLILMFLASTF